MLEEREIKEILRRTRPDAKSPHDHVFLAYTVAGSVLAKRMKLDWTHFSKHMARVAYMDKVANELAAISLIKREHGPAAAERFTHKIGFGPRQLGEALREAQSIYLDAGAKPPMTTDPAKATDAISLTLDGAHTIAPSLLENSVAERHTAAKAAEYMNHLRGARALLAVHFTEHWMPPESGGRGKRKR